VSIWHRMLYSCTHMANSRSFWRPMHVSAYCRLSLDKFRLSFQVPGVSWSRPFPSVPNFRDYQRPNQGISGLESVTKLNTMVGVLHFTNFYWLLIFYFYTSYKERVNGS